MNYDIEYSIDGFTGDINNIQANLADMEALQQQIVTYIELLRETWATTASVETFNKLENFFSKTPGSTLSMFLSEVDVTINKLNSALGNLKGIDNM